MMVKNLAVAALLLINLALLGAILAHEYAPPTALAQVATGLSGNYLAVTGEIQDQFDALYVLDLRSRFLHVFYYDRATRRLQYGGNRDLERDFRHGRGG